MPKKANIATSRLLPWDTYKDKPAEAALQSIYERASKTSTTICTWYWLSIKTKRRTSLTVRFLTLSLLIVGTVLPILAGLRDNVADRLFFTQFGVAALACGGLLQVADRVFGWSSGWLRYITTVTAMESLTRRFELDWAGCILNLTGTLNESNVKQLFDFAKRFEEEMLKLQSEETDKWVLDFNGGMALLNSLIKSQHESGEKAIEAACAAAAAQEAARRAVEKTKQSGALEVTLIHKAEAKKVSIAFDDGASEDFLGTVWSKLNLSPGQHIIHISTIEVPQQTINKIIEVPPEGVAHVEIRL